VLAHKYYGYVDKRIRITAEYQIVPMLIGLFWEVEHSALYKPSPDLQGISSSLEMQRKKREVLRALQEFEDEFVHFAFTKEEPFGKRRKST
jgi:hypothetical protein